MTQIQFSHTMFERLLRGYLKGSRTTLDAFATELGVTRQTVYNWINGDRVPPIKRVGDIAKVLKCRPQSLLKGIK
jgi:transcriptional regulator with XRE-family HTH domain